MPFWFLKEGIINCQVQTLKRIQSWSKVYWGKRESRDKKMEERG